MRNIVSISSAVLVFAETAGATATIKTAQYGTRDCALHYPADFKLSVAKRGAVIRLVSQSRSGYWADAITIRKHNKKTEECDLPQDCQSDTRDNRKIAGRVAYAYSCEDAAMNRYVRREGYFIEDKQSCWNLELTRTGRPYQKSDLSMNELNRLNRQSEIDSRKAKSAFETILKTFALVAH